MADIPFSCQACGQHLEAPDSMAGAVVQCPACAKDITIPACAEAGEPVNLLAGVLEAAETPAPAPGNFCPDCGAAMEEGSILCVECGFHTGLGKKISTELS